MDQEQAERFLAAAQSDYAHWVRYYSDLVAPAALPAEPEEVSTVRAEVLAAHEVLELARTEMHRAEVAFYDEAGTSAGRIRRKAPAP